MIRRVCECGRTCPSGAAVCNRCASAPARALGFALIACGAEIVLVAVVFVLLAHRVVWP